LIIIYKFKHMTYMQDLEQKLRAWIESFAAGDISIDAFIAFLKQSHLESYRNGQAAAPRAVANTGQPQQSGRREWRNQKRSATNAPSRQANYQS
jgi:hypothetical protein